MNNIEYRKGFLTAKVIDIFLPDVILEDGRYEDPMEPSMIGFRLQIVKCVDKRVEGMEYTVFERDTWEAAGIRMGDIVLIKERTFAYSKDYIEEELWFEKTKVLINNYNKPILISIKP